VSNSYVTIGTSDVKILHDTNFNLKFEYLHFAVREAPFTKLFYVHNANVAFAVYEANVVHCATVFHDAYIVR
jgi:hypothetical protein